MTRRKVHSMHATDKAGAVHGVRVYYVTELDEYQVDFFINGIKLAESTYHTADRQDAIGTAITHLQIVTK